MLERVYKYATKIEQKFKSTARTKMAGSGEMRRVTNNLDKKQQRATGKWLNIHKSNLHCDEDCCVKKIFLANI